MKLFIKPEYDKRNLNNKYDCYIIVIFEMKRKGRK